MKIWWITLYILTAQNAIPFSLFSLKPSFTLLPSLVLKYYSAQTELELKLNLVFQRPEFWDCCAWYFDVLVCILWNF